MNRAQALFKVIDFFFHHRQNCLKFDDITSLMDVPYVENPDKDQRVDMYFDANKVGKYPILINIHGGGFVGGDKSHRVSLSELYASKGFFVFNTNYRLAPEHIFPSAIQDIFLLLNFIKTQAESYNLDLDKIVITGDSAGAYYATQTVAALGSEELQEKFKVKKTDLSIKALLSFCGPYEVEQALKQPFPFGMVRIIGNSILGLKLNKKMTNLSEFELLNYFSPMKYVTKDWCPTFVLYAEKDIFCKGHGELFVKTLKSQGILSKEVHSTKLLSNHCYHLELKKPISKIAMNEAFKFLDETIFYNPAE